MSDETTNDVEEVVETPAKDAPKASKKKSLKAEAPVEAEVVVDEVAQDQVSEDYVEAVQEAVANTGDGSLKFTPSIAITSATVTADGTNWTFTTATNGFTVGQSVSIQGCVPTAYNGTYTLITGSNSTTVKVTPAAYTNPGSLTTQGTVEAAYPYNSATSGAYNMWNPWITAQNGDTIGYNQKVNSSDWAGAIVFQNSQYNTTQRGF